MLARIGLTLGCVLLLAVSWLAVLNIESPEDKQAALVAYADMQLETELYEPARLYLEQALGYKTKYSFDVQEKLKRVYLELDDGQAYADLLARQIAQDNCAESVYEEAVDYYLERGELAEALSALKKGIAETGAQELIAIYERERYACRINASEYDVVTAYMDGYIQVRKDGLWGLADTAGRLVIPCDYGQISTVDMSTGRVAVMKDGKLSVVNAMNRVVATFDGGSAGVDKIGNFSQGILPLRLSSGKWIIVDGNLTPNPAEYEDLGGVSNSAVAMKFSGKWGVFALDGEVVIPAEYDDIVRDELGRCYAQGAVFAVRDGKARLFADGADTGISFDDARPFTDDGWAAVKQNGKWGFVDTAGTFMIEPQFDDALSFSGHLAAVKQGELWGYLALTGKLAIEPQYLRAKSFAGGNAPVLTDRGWQFISLVEYE
ncbi:MAG: WG repeat-containing protein [Oscillospiraceae bacterium]|jgi:tetratricopeptide (TPR) repeat protein|nr:WG repeat-containing protein [Oscillospiraceae bacterium]